MREREREREREKERESKNNKNKNIQGSNGITSLFKTMLFFFILITSGDQRVLLWKVEEKRKEK